MTHKNGFCDAKSAEKMNRLERRQYVIDKYLENPQLKTWNLAKELKTSKRTIDTIIDRFKESKSVENRPQERRRQGAADPELDKKIVKLLKAHPTWSNRDIALKCGTNKAMVVRAKKRNGLKSYVKQKIPKVSEKQRQVIKTRARKLYDFLGRENVHLVIDDETYVKADFKTLAGKQYYTKKFGTTLPESIETVGHEKFGKKFLIWQTICACGARSRIFTTTGTINQDIYINECLRKRLLPFLRQHDVDCLFWPDLASAHYAKSTIKFMNDNGIRFVEKDMNPPNVPRCRPIERYWAMAKQNLLKTGKVAKDAKDLTRRFAVAAAKVDDSTVADMMKGIRAKLREEWMKK